MTEQKQTYDPAAIEPKWQQFWSDSLLDPTADLLETGVMQEMPGID